MKKNPASQESERAGSAPEGVKGLRACAGWTDTCCNETPCQWGDHPCERKKPLGIEPEALRRDRQGGLLLECLPAEGQVPAQGQIDRYSYYNRKDRT